MKKILTIWKINLISEKEILKVHYIVITWYMLNLCILCQIGFKEPEIGEKEMLIYVEKNN